MVDAWFRASRASANASSPTGDGVGARARRADSHARPVEFSPVFGVSLAHQYLDFKAELEQLLGRHVDRVELGGDAG